MQAYYSRDKVLRSAQDDRLLDFLNSFDISTTIDQALIELELSKGKEVIVQFVTKSYTSETLSDLNELCSRNGKRLCVRFYGHYHGYFDCAIALQLPDVKCLYIDCHQAKNIDSLSELLHLEELGLSIFELQQTEILGCNNFKQLKTLSIGETKTNSLNLEYLREYINLTELRIASQTKNIDTIGELHKMKSLSLRGIRKAPLKFINRLESLKRLDLILGSRANINEIDDCAIEQLQIVQVRGFNDLGDLSRFSHLQKLVVENQLQLPKLNFTIEFPYLTELSVLRCKTFDTLTGLTNLPALESLIISNTKIEFDQFIQQPLPNSLKHLGFYTWKAKADALIKDTLHKKGYSCN